VATFIAFTLASLTFHPLDALEQRNPRPPQATIDAKAAELHLNQPLFTRFFSWIGNVVTHFNFGNDTTGHPITDQLFARVGVSLRLLILGTVIGVILGVLIGVASAIKQYSLTDYVSTFFSYIILATPVFVIAPLAKAGALDINSAFNSDWLKFDGSGTTGFEGSFWASLVDRLRYLIVPTFVIVLNQIAYYSRYQRSAMLDVLGSDFLRTAQAKGLTRGRALYKHGLRTALIPMATLFAFGFGLLITGATLTETIFNWFGMGQWFITGLSNQDTNVTATVTLFVAICVLFSGWLSDILYALLDPRVRI
jgi:peptide/nickel transport system permease protein